MFPAKHGDTAIVECVLLGISCFLSTGFANDSELAFEIIPAYQKQIMKNVSKQEYDTRTQSIQSHYSDFRDLAIHIQEDENGSFEELLKRFSTLAAQKYNASQEMDSLYIIGASILEILHLIDPKYK